MLDGHGRAAVDFPGIVTTPWKLDGYGADISYSHGPLIGLLQGSGLPFVNTDRNAPSFAGQVVALMCSGMRSA
jgi:hypothetical protein